MADKDISSVMENKYKLIEACEEDIEKIQEQVENYAKDDQFQRRRYEMDKQQSDEFLQQNKEKQQSVWNRVFELLKEFQNCEAELVTLSRERKKEVERRLVVEERESSRRGGQGAFLAAAEEHAQNLLETVENAESARALAEELNAFILDNCASIAEKYDRQQQTLADMLRVVQQYHFQKFSDYYVSAHRFLYRKTRQVERIKEQMTANTMKREIYVETLDPNAKKYADENEKLLMQRRELEEEIHSLRSRIDKAEQQVEPTLRALDFANVSYVHPREVVEKMVLTRWETMLRYKEELSSNVVEGEPGVAAIVSKKEHEEEIQTIQALRSTLQRSKKENNTNNNNAQQQMTAPPATATTSDSLVPRPPQSAFAKRVQSFLERQLSVRDEGEEDTKDTDATGRLHKTYPQKAAAVTSSWHRGHRRWGGCYPQ
ncbi:Paraflagellar rod protein, putative [Angomonas deanei]|uniref:Paraflagellar rod protein, putative n=1 Tax=Angomonas deanei TaxID=59799 RepID=A0A7G2CNN8_9TRYP|nr:Paraflagellar rod protein, putative [Angomonas deanei]